MDARAALKVLQRLHKAGMLAFQREWAPRVLGQDSKAIAANDWVRAMKQNSLTGGASARLIAAALVRRRMVLYV